MQDTITIQFNPKRALLGLAILSGVAIAFGHLIFGNHIFLSWDDTSNIVNNQVITALSTENLSKMFTGYHLGVYEPLGWLFKTFLVALFGLSPKAFHLFTLLLHLFNVSLLYLVSKRIFPLVFKDSSDQLKQNIIVASIIVALLYGLHPLRVEIVVWASGQPYALATSFFLLSILFYLKHAEQDRKLSPTIVLSIAFYLCAVLSKSAAIALPGLLLLLDVYPLKRWNLKRSLMEKVPYFVIAALIAGMALHATKLAQESNILDLDWSQKTARAMFAILAYLFQTIWPAELMPHYKVNPDTLSLFEPQYSISAVIVITISVYAWMARGKRPWLFTVWFGYLILVLPVLGLVQHGTNVMHADRYTYLTMFGFYFLIGGFLIRTEKWLAYPGVFFPIVILIFCSIFTFQQTRYWKDTESLWTRTIHVDPGNSFAYNNLGFYLMQQEQFNDAESILKTGVALTPENIRLVLNYGYTLEKLGKKEAAIVFYNESIKYHPDEWGLFHNLGSLYAQKGDYGAAKGNYQRALALNPNSKLTKDNLEKLPQLSSK